MPLAGASTATDSSVLIPMALFGLPVLLVVAGFVLLARGNRAAASLALGLGSLGGLYDPLLIAPGIAAVYLGWTAFRRSAGRLNPMALGAIGLGVLGSLASLVFPAFIVYGWSYAAFHGGRLPF